MLTSRILQQLATEVGFHLVGAAPAGPVGDFARYRDWVDRGLAGEMRYLTDHRADLRADPANLLPGVRSIICLGLLYNGPQPHSMEFSDPERAWISRYAWGDDYHDVIRAKLSILAAKLNEIEAFDWRACVDTAPLLERSLARQAGLGWVGKNTCLINQQAGSWFFLGELLTTLDLAPDSPPPDRCGTCTRCIDACPTAALTPYELDATLCISYFTIELRSPIPAQKRSQLGSHIFGCDICQDVCPWNQRAPESAEAWTQPTAPSGAFAPALERMADLTEFQFREMFRHSPVSRAKYSGFLRNVAVAMGNAGLPKFREPLLRLASSGDPLVAEHAEWALEALAQTKRL